MPSGLSESLGTSFGPLGAYAFAAVVVLVLILVVLFVLKRATGGSAALSAMRKGPRLAVLDVAAVDQRRKLVLVRRDEVEHLVFVGGETDIVVEAGIIRAPAALRNGPATVRAEPELATVQPRAFPAAIAPEPHPRTPESTAVRQPSPLRRTVPNGAPRQPAEEAAEAATIQVAPTPSAPRPVRREMPSEPRSETIPPIVPAARRETPQPAPFVPQAERAPAPMNAAPQTNAVGTAPSERFEDAAIANAGRNTSPAAKPDRPEPIEAEPRVPEFLRRTDVPRHDQVDIPPPVREAPAPMPAATDPVAPIVRPPVAPEPAIRRADVALAGDRSMQEATPRPRPESQLPTRIDPFDAPIVGPSEPVLQREPETPPQMQPQRPIPAGPAATPEAVGADLRETGERQPLQVRSFASVIQSRRPPEPARQPMPAPAGPSPAPRAAEPAPMASSFPNQDRPQAVQTSEQPGSSREPDFDDALSRGLDDDFRAVDWSGGDDRTVPPVAPAVRPDVPTPRPSAPPAGAQDAPKAERRPTLEEEMERLLGDFDFNANKRP